MSAFRRCLLPQGLKPQPSGHLDGMAETRPLIRTSLRLHALPFWAPENGKFLLSCDIRHKEIQPVARRDLYQGKPLRRADNPSKRSRL
jgi:hypothetical protein